MFKKLLYSSVIVSNINNIKCAEELKSGTIKYIINNLYFIGVNNIKFEKDEKLKIKDLDFVNFDKLISEKLNNLWDNNNNITDYSTYDKKILKMYIPYERATYYILQEQKPKLVKLVITDNTTNKSKTLENNELLDKSGKLLNNFTEDEVVKNEIKNNTDYVFHYEYVMTFPKESIKIQYNNKEYTNKSEIKIDNNFNETLDKTSDPIISILTFISKHITDEKNETLDKVMSANTKPKQIIKFTINNNKDKYPKESFYLLLLYHFYKNTFKSLEMTVDNSYHYPISFEKIKGYFLEDKEFCDNNDKYEYSKEELTKDGIKKMLAGKYGINEDCLEIETEVEIKNKDEKLKDNTKITVKFNIEKLKDTDFMKKYIIEKKYQHKIELPHIQGYSIKDKYLKNTDIKDGKIENLEDLKKLIKNYFDLDEDQYNKGYKIKDEGKLKIDFNDDSDFKFIKLEIIGDEIKNKLYEKSKNNNNKENETNITNKNEKKEEGCCRSDN